MLMCGENMAARALCIGLFIFAMSGFSSAVAQSETRISRFSEKPVPRFESLRKDKVYGRRGPSFEHPIDWTYARAGLPVMVIKESPSWCRVRDPDGVEVWIHKRLLSTKATGITNQDALLKRDTQPESEDLAILKPGIIVDVLDNLDGMVKVRAGGLTGWVNASHVWGHSGV